MIIYLVFACNNILSLLKDGPKMTDKQSTKNIFNSEGRLLHAELALKNVGEAGTIAGMVCTDGIILIGINPNKSSTIEKIYKLNDEVHIGVAGVFSDALRLIKYARLQSANHVELMGRTPKLSILCESVAKTKQEYTQIVGARPFGVAFLYCGYEDGDYVLYSTDPSGTVNRWKAYSFGMDSEKINGEFRNMFFESEKTNVETGAINIMQVIGKVREWSEDVSTRMEMLIYSKQETKMMTSDDIRNLINSSGHQKH